MQNGKPFERGESKEFALNQDEVRRFEAAARNPREKAAVRLLARWGLRADEVGHFSIAWLSTQRGVLTVPRSCRCDVCQERGEAWTCKKPASHRSLPVAKHTETWEAIKVFLVHEPTPEDAVVSRQAVWKLTKQVADRAGILHRVFPHALRATAATQFASMGANELQLCRLMGWDDLRSARPYISSSVAVANDFLDGRDLRWW